MQTDIVPEEMTLAELVDHLPARDARVVRKMLNAMVDWNISLPRAIACAEVFWRTKGHYDKAEFEGFEKSVDQWMDAGKRYG